MTEVLYMFLSINIKIGYLKRCGHHLSLGITEKVASNQMYRCFWLSLHFVNSEDLTSSKSPTALYKPVIRS
jgi:hypothetical protein